MLLPEVAGPKAAAATGALSEAAASLELGRGVTIVVSPHGHATGVYTSVVGDLDAFGPRGVSVAPATDEGVAAALARAWGRDRLSERVDHGVVVALRLLHVRGPVIAVAFREGMDAAEAAAEAAAMADAVRALDCEPAFVASANLSAGLSEAAPLSALPGASASDERVLDALRTRPRGLRDALEDVVRSGSCAAAPLAAFASLFPDRACSILAYDHPFGVGHVVAVTR